VRNSVADISKARMALGYSPAVSLETGLRHVVDWYRAASSGADRPSSLG